MTLEVEHITYGFMDHKYIGVLWRGDRILNWTIDPQVTEAVTKYKPEQLATSDTKRLHSVAIWRRHATT